jgi:hypothetical protein
MLASPSPCAALAPFVASLSLPSSSARQVTALGDALSEVSSIAMRRSIRETDYLSQVDALLLDEARGDPDETLTEAEFLISVLKSKLLVRRVVTPSRARVTGMMGLDAAGGVHGCPGARQLTHVITHSLTHS